MTPVVAERPSTLFSVTTEKRTGCGKMYITMTLAKGADGKARVFEVFNQMGKAGGCAASQSEMAGRLISTALRSDIEAGVLIKQLKGISCHAPFGFGENRVNSCADAIAQAMEELQKNIGQYSEILAAFEKTNAAA